MAAIFFCLNILIEENVLKTLISAIVLFRALAVASFELSLLTFVNIKIVEADKLA